MDILRAQGLLKRHMNSFEGPEHKAWEPAALHLLGFGGTCRNNFLWLQRKNMEKDRVWRT
jgi:hypothetical protein